MRLGKRIIPVLLAACITSVTPLTSLALPAVSADAEETGVAAEDEIIKTQDNKEECDIKINSLTTAGTYYGIDGKFPIYAEYDATGVVYHSPYEGEEGPEANRQNLKLVITKEDGTEFIAEENFGSFEIKDCTGFENGQSYKLDFSVKYVQSGEGTDGITLYSVEKTVTFIEQESWALCNYLPTREGVYNLDLYVHNTTVPDKDKDDDDDDDGSKGYSVSNISLIDKNGQAAASTNTKWGVYFSDDDKDKRYYNILRNSYSLKGMDIYHADCEIYCTRELEAGEELEAVYYIDGKMYKTGIKFTVTDKPYIKEADESSRYTADNICRVKVQAYNTDFNKLSLSLTDNETGKVLGSSVKFIQEYNNSAVYYVQCNNGKPANGSYNILYNYSGNGIDVISENAARYYYIHNDTYKNNIYSATCTQNYKTDSIEYYDANIPSGAAISYEIRYYGGTVCTSGGGIIADNNHVAVIPLKKELEDGTLRQNTEVWYYVYITYADINGKTNTSFSIFNPGFFSNYRHLSVCNPDLEYNWVRDCYYYMDKSPYLPDSKELEFAIKFKCYNEDKLKSTCTATIYEGRNKVGTVELSLKNENGSLSYNGTYKGSLNNKSMYSLLFNPYQGNIYFNDNIDIDGEDFNNISCYFNIADSSRMCLKSQHNYLASGEVLMCFPSEEIADYYCGEDNLKIKEKLKVKILGLNEDEIGTYKYANNDFTITGKKFYRVIKFSGSAKQKLANINYCKVYLYYGDGKEEDTIIADSEHPEESFYSTEYDSSNIYRPEYIKNSHRNSGFIALGNNKNIAPNDYYYDNAVTSTGFTTVYGSESAFPATVTVTGWYNDIETIKTITVPEPGYNFTESDLEGLSPDKKYNFFIKGADGSVNAYMNSYIIKSGEEDNKPGNNKPSGKPEDNKPGNNNPGGNPGVGTGIIVPYPQAPSATPEASLTPAPAKTPEVSGTPQASTIPETSGTPQTTAVPDISGAPQASNQPETSLTPQATNAPEIPGVPVTTVVPGKPEDVKNNIKKGTKVTDKKSQAVYKVTKTGKNKTVKYIESAKQAPANIIIPDSVKINGSVYKVTSVGKSAFKNNKKLKSVQIGKNVASIGAKAFYGCKKLHTITVKTNKLKSANIGKNAFGNGFSSPQVKAAKSKWKLYKKIFQAKGMPEKCKFKKL